MVPRHFNFVSPLNWPRSKTWIKTVFDVRLDFTLSYILSLYHFWSSNVFYHFRGSRSFDFELDFDVKIGSRWFSMCRWTLTKLHFITLSFFDWIICSITLVVSRPLILTLIPTLNFYQNGFRCAAGLYHKLHFILLSFFHRTIYSIALSWLPVLLTLDHP